MHPDFRLQGCHLLRPPFPEGSANPDPYRRRDSFNPPRCRDTRGLGFGAFARRYLRHHFCFLFLRVLRCFSSPGSLPSLTDDGIPAAGLPHSEIRASQGMCPSARLIAACHVLLRLREPKASFMRPSLLSFSLKRKGLCPGSSPSRITASSPESGAVPRAFASADAFIDLSLLFARVIEILLSIMSMSSSLLGRPWQS